MTNKGRYLLSFFLFLFLFKNSFSQVGIGISEPHASAALDISAKSKGVLIPRVTEAQRNQIQSPEIGLIVFNTDINCISYFLGTEWLDVCGLRIGTIESVECQTATASSSIYKGVPIQNTSIEVKYSGANGGVYASQNISSTGVAGISASISSGVLNSGEGAFLFYLSGTPQTIGTAYFQFNIGGQFCSISVEVFPEPFSCGKEISFDYNGENVTYGTIERNYQGIGSVCWMDRNLGAKQTANGSTDNMAYGDLFQWGRMADGHQVVSPPSSTVNTLDSDYQPQHSDFILAENVPHDWLEVSNNFLWEGNIALNNPCPQGWRVPTYAEMYLEMHSWQSQDLNGAMASPLKLPAAGYRDYAQGEIQEADQSGYYWTSTPGGNKAKAKSIYHTQALIAEFSRGRGLSVRCVKSQ